MSLRAKRLIAWMLCIVLSVLCIVVEDNFLKEKTALTVNVPENMEYAFEKALSAAGLKQDYKIVMTESNEADIIVDYAKEDDKAFTKFAFSPFVVAYTHDDKYFNKLVKSEVLVPSEFDKDHYEIDFIKVVNEVIEEGRWANLGVEDLNNVKVFYPAENTNYFHDFYDFMLVTVNMGKYPSSEGEMKNAKEAVDRFFNSEHTEAVTDFKEQVSRTGGFTNNAFWIMPENVVIDLRTYRRRIIYPSSTVYFNYYIKANEVGNKVINAFGNNAGLYGNFYGYLRSLVYRTQEYSELYVSNDSYLYGFANIYNIVRIPEKTTSTSAQEIN